MYTPFPPIVKIELLHIGTYRPEEGQRELTEWKAQQEQSKIKQD